MAFGIDDAVAISKAINRFQTCRICGENKPLSQFHFRKDNQKHRTECFECKSVIHKSYYDKKYKEIAKSKSRQFREKDQRIALLSSCKHTSKIKRIEFSITVDDINIPEYCPLLGLKLTNIQGVGRVDTNASVDRIDPKKGYVKGNIQILSYKANKMKQDATKQELITFCKNVIKMFEEK